MVYSFDIFDTCLVRACGVPENIFDLLSYQAFSVQVEESLRREFVVARQEANRKSASNPFSTIFDIYNEFSYENNLLLDKDEIIKLELKLEHANLIPVYQQRETINQLRSAGNHIIYISDMYLPEPFIRDIMVESGFLAENDTLYVSCDIGKRKDDGELFRYIHDEESLSYKQWHHYGDNELSDFIIPRRLGIKANIIEWKYSYYENIWKSGEPCYSILKRNILSSVCRSINLGNEHTTHSDFVIDIVAPFYASFVYKILNDAEKKGLKRLYFCSRDGYAAYRVALLFKGYFSVSVHYLYISQTALYENGGNQIGYYSQIGLATRTEDVGIVDMRTTGHTLVYLNDLLTSNGYRNVRGYYYEMYSNGEKQYKPTNYYSIINKLYCFGKGEYYLLEYWHLYEMLFMPNSQKRVIAYEKNDESFYPVFDDFGDSQSTIHGDVKVCNLEKWEYVHLNLVEQFVRRLIDLNLLDFVEDYFSEIAMPTLIDFFNNPVKEYVFGLQDYIAYSHRHNDYLSYVRKEGFFEILKNRGNDSIWKRGTLALSLPKPIYRLYRKYKQSRKY